MEDKTITLSQLQEALMRTFNHYSWDTTDYDVWVGIHSFFAEDLWRRLGGEELAQNAKPNDLKKPKTCRHENQWDKKESEIVKSYKKVFANIYRKVPPLTH